MRSLRRGVALTVTGNFIYGAGQWAVVIVLARLGNPAQVGQFALGLALTAPLVLLGNLQLRMFQATDPDGEHDFADYLGLRILTSLLALAAIGVVAGAFGFDRVTASVIVWIGVAKVFESISDIVYGLLQRLERLDVLSRSMTAKGIVSFSAVGLAMMTTHSVAAAAASLAASWGLLLFLYDLPSAHRAISIAEGGAEDAPGRWLAFPQPRWRAERLRALGTAALPLGFASFMESLCQNAPRYFVDALIGHAGLGVFAAATYIVAIGNTFVASIGQAAGARLSRFAARAQTVAFDQLALRLTLVAICVGIPGVIISIVAGHRVLSAVYGPEYASQVAIFGWIMTAGLLGYVVKMLQYILIVLRRVMLQLALDALGLAVVVVVSIVSIPRLHILGVALAMVASAGVQAVAAGVAAVQARGTIDPRGEIFPAQLSG
jgi:O-antigen/teichoic acid export membrane protein